MRMELDLKGDKELIAALKRVDGGVERVLQRAALAGAQVIRGEANQRAPGPHVEMDVSMPRKRRIRVDIGPDRDHWYYMVFETGAVRHGIKPSRRRLLRFEDGGEEVFARRVEHRGMAARPFLRPAMDERKSQAVDAVGDVLRGVLK